MSTETFVIKYVILGREDGSWKVQAFDRHDRKLGAAVYVQTPREAWKVYCLLNGISHVEPHDIIEAFAEKTERIA